MSVFDLPFGAKPGQDRVVGQDDLGRTVYVTGAGQRYTAPLPPRPRMAPGPLQGPTAYAAPSRIAEMQQYAQQFPGAMTAADLEAAGFTAAEIDAFRPMRQPAAPEAVAASMEQYGALQPADPTLRENAIARVQDALMNQVGMDAYTAGRYARDIMGDPAASGTILDSLGLADLTPFGAAFAVQEGGRTFQRGRETGDPLTMGMGALEAGLGILEATPLAGAIFKGIGNAARGIDPNTLFTVFGPPPGGRSPLEPPRVEAPEAAPAAPSAPPAPLTFTDVERVMQEAPAAPGLAPITPESAALPPPPTSPSALPAPPPAFDRVVPPAPAPVVPPRLATKLVSSPERAMIKASVPRKNIAGVQDQIASQKASYPSDQGWAQDVMEIRKVDPKKDKKGNILGVEVTYKEIPYGFDKPPMGMSAEDWQRTMVDRQVQEIRNLADRVKAGDPAAQAIVNEANWYRSMRTALRREFGGMGDVFADVLGATSAQTGVEMNWNNAIEIMRRFSRGEYDEELRMYKEMLDAGDVNPNRLTELHKDPNNPFKLVTNAAGALFNTNSPAATKALFDMFRVADGAPKTPNFTGNLIGYTNAATIDVWDARHLRRLAGLPRLPPPVEKGVTGKHLKGSTLEQPRIGGEFGFGQRVKADAARTINEQGIIRDVAPNLQDLNPDDLQAVAWFIEKERWTNNGWTNKAGEGGSFEFEASLAGASDPAAVRSLRRELNQGFTAPNRRKTETDEQYAARVDQARTAFDTRQAQAQAELDEMKAPLARYMLGISVERPGMRPTNVQQAEIASRLGEPAKGDPSVVMYQINNTYGRFMQSDERAFNAEFVVRRNFDPTGVTRRMVEVAREADQDAAFISKVVPQRTPESRPGVEIYFRKRQDPAFARRLSDKLTEYGVDGFTFVTDSRVMDRPSAQAGISEEAVAGINGLRFQYIPEFDMGKEAWAAMSPAERAAKIDEVSDLFDDIANDIVETEEGISAANLMHYETNVIERGDYDEYLR